MKLTRTSRFIAIVASLLFFVLTDPLMLKITPDIIKSQLGNISPSQINITIFKRAMLTVISTLVTLYGTIALSAMFTKASKYMTSAIIDYANSFKYDNKIWVGIAENVVFVILLCVISAFVIKKSDSEK